MLTKEDIRNNADLQLQVIKYYYPDADPSGKFFAIREENTPSSKLRLFKGVWFLKDFGDSKKAQDCFAVVMEKESCDFNLALKKISDITPFATGWSNQQSFSEQTTKTEVASQIKAISNNPKEKATNYLQSRSIDVNSLPDTAYYYDSYKHAVAFIDSEKNVLNKRLIEPGKGESKARMSKYSGFNPVYDALYNSENNRVFITEGVIDSLSLLGHSSLSIFTTSNLIKDSEKLKPYIESKEIIIAFDNDDAGIKCADYYAELINNSGIDVATISRLVLPQGKDVNALLMEGTLESFLGDDGNYTTVQNSNEERSHSSENEEENVSGTFNATKNEQIEEFLNSRYKVRYNSIKQQPEFKKVNSKAGFVPIDKYVLNSLRRELNKNGINTSAQNIKSILESDYSLLVHPIQEYFKNLPAWNQERDYIKEFAQTIKVDDPEVWIEYFKKWLIAVVANVLTEVGCQNHTCLVITGKQGAFKTTWLDNLCPQSLKQYLFTGKIDPSNKDSLTCIAEYFLINIDDQLRQLNKRDENELKNLITTPSVKYRRPYDVYITEYPHTASFMASVNGNDFLTDPTGSRRFLPFEALEIDIDAAKAIDMDMVYAQVIHLYKEGVRYWFDHSEIDALHKHNQAFQVVSMEEQLVLEYFEKPDNREGASDYLQSAIIQSYLENFTKTRLSSKKLGEALTKLGFEKWQMTKDSTTKWVWSVIKKPLPQVEHENNNNPY